MTKNNDEDQKDTKAVIIPPGSELHAKVGRLAKKVCMSSAISRYNQVGEMYNEAGVGSYIRLPSLIYRISNVEKVLHNRGIERDTDYMLFRANRSEDGKPLEKAQKAILIQKLTPNLMRII